MLGDDAALDGTGATVASVGLAGASMSFAVSGVYGLLAVMRTFGRCAPDVYAQVRKRALLPDGAAQTARAARLLLARLRGAVVIEWKLARFKRAMQAFLVGVAFVLLVNLVVLVAAI